MKTWTRPSFLILLLVIVQFVQAQPDCETTTFQKAYGNSNENDHAHTIIETPDRGFIAAGWATPLLNHGMLMKVNFKGDVVWLKQLAGNNTLKGYFKKLARTRDGNYLAIGMAYLPLDSFHDDLYTWLVKFDENGNILWNKMYFPPGGYSAIPNGLTEASDGSIVIVGTSQLVPNLGGAYVTRLDGSGNILWTRYKGATSMNSGIWHTGVIEKNGALFITCGESANGAGGIIKMNLGDGALLEASLFKIDNKTTWFNSIEEKNGKFYVSGATRDVSLDQVKPVVLITDVQLNIISTHTINCNFPRVYDVAPLAAGNDEGYLIAPSSEYAGDILLARITDDGTVKWKREYARSGSQVVNQLKQTADGGIVGVATTNRDESPFFLPGNDILIFKMNGQGKSGDCQASDPMLSVSKPSCTKSPEALSYTNLSFATTIVNSNEIPVNLGLRTFCENLFTPKCTSIQVSGKDTICNFTEQVVYDLTRNSGCDLPITWNVNPDFVQIISSTDSRLVVQYKKAGETEISARISNDCENVSFRMSVHIFKSPEFVDLGADKTLCENTEVKLVAEPSFKSYLWQDGSTSSQLSIRNPGKYYVTTTNYCHETFSDTVLVSAAPTPVNFLPVDTTVCEGYQTVLKPLSSFNGYLWSTGATTSSITVNSFGNYSLEVTNQFGCVGTDEMKVIKKDGCVIAVYLPSAFTPNSNGLNDHFKATAYGQLNKFHLTVYNRNGNLVFETRDISKGWNGIFRGVAQDTGTFVWYCEYEFNNGQPQKKKGVVTLIR